jgi:hypothetical protein
MKYNLSISLNYRSILGSLLVGAVAFLVSAEKSSADTILDTDFANGSFSQLGYTPYTVNNDGTTDTVGSWSEYDASAYNAGTVALYDGRSNDNGSLTTTFSTLSGSAPLTLDFDAGWLRVGAGGDSTTALGVELLDSNGNGYAFEDHNADAAFGAGWALVTDYTIGSFNFSDIDTAQSGLAGGGSLEGFTITRDANGDFTWTSSAFSDGPASNGNTPTDELTFTDTTTTSFDQLALLGPPNVNNYGGPVYNDIVLDATVAPEPSTVALMMMGLGGLVVLGLRKSKLSLS